jgi:hypothetical protein
MTTTRPLRLIRPRSLLSLLRPLRPVRRVAVASIACAGLIAAGTSVASATTPTTGLTALKAKAAADITARVDALNLAIPQVNVNAVITAADKATLLGILNGDLTSLTALGQTIAADTTTAQASSDTKTIFTSYRVFALAIPQVAYAAGADDITVAELPALLDSQKALSEVLRVEPSKNTAAVQSAMADLSHQIAAATSSTSGLSNQVLAYTPAQYNANHALLSGPRQTLVTAQADVVTAKNDITVITAALQ